MDYLIAIFLFFNTSIGWTQEYIDCQIKHQPGFHHEFKTECGGPEFFISKQTLAKNLKLNLLLELEHQNGSDFKDVFLSLKIENRDCKSIICVLNQKDIIDYIKTNDTNAYKEIENKIAETVKTEKNKYKINIANTQVVSAALHPHTPAFQAPVHRLYQSDQDVLLDDNLIGTLSSSAPANTIALDYSAASSTKNISSKTNELIIPDDGPLDIPTVCTSSLVSFSFNEEIFYDEIEELVVIILENHKRYRNVQSEGLPVVEISYCLIKKSPKIKSMISNKKLNELNKVYAKLKCELD